MEIILPRSISHKMTRPFVRQRARSAGCVCVPGMKPKFSMKIILIVSSTHFLLINITVLKKNKKHFQEIANINGTNLMGSNALY